MQFIPQKARFFAIFPFESCDLRPSSPACCPNDVRMGRTNRLLL
ncbi:hypothetical protein HMPREF3036_02655 [Sutterella sp. KLE1602]|nr:hypothetical protein HMPREF3036_02655 [Sutterella sp. KLE1602]